MTRAVLHIGLPKTGTTTLQNHTFQRRDELIRQKINYPNLVVSNHDPKHQFLVGELRSGRFPSVKALLSETGVHTFAFSVEGLSNQFWDFSQGQMALFRAAFGEASLDIFVVTREEREWYRSYYKQCVINPPVDGYPYATTLDFETFCEIPRVRFLAELPKRPDLIKSAFGAENVVFASLEGTWLDVWYNLIGATMTSLDVKIPHSNKSLDDRAIDIVLAVNRHVQGAELRSRLLGGLQLLFQSNSLIMISYQEFLASSTIAEIKDCMHTIDCLASTTDAWDSIASNVKELICDYGNRHA